MDETGEKVAKGEAFGWGIIGSGEVARRSASDLKLVPGAVLVANHSRTMAHAESFREAFGVDSPIPISIPSLPTRQSTPSISPPPTRCIWRRP